ncbi:carbohydrate-binding family 9-like protein [Spirosoma sp. KNUC1025]|uniref:carbohydrate-binding family 9-like protein n=1 Tax=Spirosoma sp. KNUC1025 TaxID=2894082 RepID=UPI003867C8D5|nr:carbohydrate-binding family 9-like protein [Spirosoma sp. KNUC1025]
MGQEKRTVPALVILLGLYRFSFAQVSDTTRYLIKKTTDFQVNGIGDYAGWNKTSWVPITVQESANRALTTKTKVLYSETGIYFLFQCDDEKLTATIEEDFGALFKEDVVEVFLWPDPSVPIYLEYEVSPLNYELPILVPNINGKFQGWKPWNYRGSAKTQHATSVQGGNKTSNASIKGWTAEFFIPYRLMNPIVSATPTSGTTWRGNLYRIDYDTGYQTWSWKKTSGSFHEFKRYGTLIFE